MTQHRKHDFRSTRRWKQLRLRILARDLWSCQIRSQRCLHTANEVDHITPPGQDEVLRWAEWNLRAACGPCNNGRNNPRLAMLAADAPQRLHDVGVGGSERKGGFVFSSNTNRATLAALSPRANLSPIFGDYTRKKAL